MAGLFALSAFFLFLGVCALAVRLIRLNLQAHDRIAAIRLGEERQQMKDEARRNEMLVSLLQGLGDACLILDPELQIAFANDEANELFQSRISVIGRSLHDVFPDHRLTDAVIRSLRDRVSIEENLAVSIPAGTEDGRHFLVLSVAPIRIPGVSKGDYLRVILRDETRKHEIEQIRKDFVANASHELRTPLSIINGYLENMIDGMIDDPEMIQRSLVTMQKHGTRLARIVEDMLTLSRFDAATEHDAASLKKDLFSCESCARDVLDRLSPVIEEKRAQVVLEFEPGHSDLAGDRFYWDQVFFNLIENALKENLKPGLVIHVGMRTDNSGVTLWVRDNGVGIPKADLPFIFKRFYRVAKHHGQEIKGTGLGLSIVRRAVEAHGGTISVDSTQGVRTQFTIHLPPNPTANPAADDLAEPDLFGVPARSSDLSTAATS